MAQQQVEEKEDNRIRVMTLVLQSLHPQQRNESCALL